GLWEANAGKVHPTQKPVALFEYLIKTYTNEGDLVLDNCAGSGTTGVACKNLKRNCILIEKDEQYYKIAKRRIDNTMENLL
ncbi:MAG TPA: site-specific DNA-methyltransferase, partial [Candidatus Dojkabacteria bacterium]|nr:site-specific DNA-methyltransferase [Candidatus Dojkabacteria bacterium]